MDTVRIGRGEARGREREDWEEVIDDEGEELKRRTRSREERGECGGGKDKEEKEDRRSREIEDKMEAYRR